jgi:putative nucleotidyltransferase with HDIG domain
LAVRTVIVTFTAIAVILLAVHLVLVVELRDRATRAVVDNLGTGQRVVALLQERRNRELGVHSREVADDLNIGLALRRLQTDPPPDGAESADLARLIELRVHELDDQLHLDAVAVVDRSRRVVARAGRDQYLWSIGKPVALTTPLPAIGREEVYATSGGFYRALVVPIQAENEKVGELHLASALDQQYADSLSALTRAPTLITVEGRLVACTLSPAMCERFGQVAARGALADGVIEVQGERWLVRQFLNLQGTSVLGLDSLSAVQRTGVRDAVLVFGTVGLCALFLGAIASFWLARTVSRPIDDLSRTLADIATSRRFDIRLPRPGTSREVDALTNTFNELMRSLATAEAETRAACVGAIRALAAALDARDPYTAGHSERVSALAVSIARQMHLPEDDLDVLRLGALLHDIGKIGVSDNVLRKPGPLTVEEFEAIKTHPRLGSRILRSVPFLAPHLPIVELHHERPDGQGYPHGLVAEEIPVLARIVRVADAFDAMTSARAYRPPRPASDAITELWRFAGSHFDTEVVGAFAAAWPSMASSMMSSEWPGTLDASRLKMLLPFSPRAERAWRTMSQS